jgi:hypothetical protein
VCVVCLRVRGRGLVTACLYPKSKSVFEDYMLSFLPLWFLDLTLLKKET